ncbi:MAG: VOC family protein [Acidimicrobiales bacterium]
MITSGFPNIVASSLPATKAWYVELLGWATEFDSDRFVHLKAPDVPGVELGIIAAGHEIVPPALEPGPAGVLLTVVDDDVDAPRERARGLGHEVIEEPRDLFYGQRRMILRDPAGTLVDVSSECEPSQEFLAGLAQRSEHGGR